VALNFLRISALLALATTVACGGSPSENLDAATSFPDGGQDGDAGSGWPAVWPGQTGIDGGPWIPSQTCWDRAVALVELLTPAQCYGQMTTVDSSGLTVSEATSALLGSVFSGGSSDPTSATTGAISNLIPDWVAMISSYLDVAKGFVPHAGLLYGLDSVHGNNNVEDAVIFPHSIGIGASRNPALAEQLGRITAIEMLGVGANWAFTPTVAAAQDERWGRTYETFGEKNELTSQMGAAEVKGLQNGKLGSPQSVLACAKHYAGDGNTDGGKNSGNVTTLDEATFRQLAIEPYRPAIEAGVGAIMVSYSSFQGTKMTASQHWLTDVLKGELGFQGFLVSDWDAVSQLPGNWTLQVKTAFNAGLDMAMLSHGSGAKTAASLASTLSDLVSSGGIPVERIKDAVRRILTVKCEMGLLDGDTTIDPALTAAIGSAEHRAVAREAVRESLVLLKNDGTLPLPKTLARIHVTGSAASSLSKQCGGWTLGWQGLGSATGTDSTTGTTVQAAIKNLFAGSSTTVTTSTDGSGAEGADYAIVVVGEPPYAEGKGDTTNPTLVNADFAAIAKVKAAGVPFAVVLFSGRPLVLTDAGGVSALDEANAFIAAWLPGTEGEGITDVLFGDYKPTGKLSFTWPAALAQIPIHDGDGQVPLFPYGYGLTYP
jgi:beta-glucosidase